MALREIPYCIDSGPGGTTNKERARAQSRQALRVIEGFFFTIRFSLKLVIFSALIWHLSSLPRKSAQLFHPSDKNYSKDFLETDNIIEQEGCTFY